MEEEAELEENEGNVLGNIVAGNKGLDEEAKSELSLVERARYGGSNCMEGDGDASSKNEV